jgi:S-adenosylmethionine/arginine decarboxylase-like enzyme
VAWAGQKNINRIKKEWKNIMQPHLQHKHLLVRAEVNSPPQKNYDLESELTNLVNHIDMKILAGPTTAYCPVPGNVGWSGVVIIETSSITFHSWTESHYPVIQLDVYSCKHFSVDTILLWLRQFDPEKIDYKFLDREHDFKEISSNSLNIEENTQQGIYI